MKIEAVSNSTPLIYLARLGKIEFLKKLFGRVYIPKEVFILEGMIKEGFIETKEVKKPLRSNRIPPRRRDEGNFSVQRTRATCSIH